MRCTSNEALCDRKDCFHSIFFSKEILHATFPITSLLHDQQTKNPLCDNLANMYCLVDVSPKEFLCTESFSKNWLIFFYLLWFTEASQAPHLSQCSLSSAHVKGIAAHIRVLFQLSLVLPYKPKPDFVGFVSAVIWFSWLKCCKFPTFNIKFHVTSQMTLAPLMTAKSNSQHTFTFVRGHYQTHHNNM